MTYTLSLLRDIDAYTFDVFGTTVDWFTTIKRQVALRSNGVLQDQDAADFACEWRQGYFAHILAVNAGGQGTLNLDVAHREILDQILASERWSHLATIWDNSARSDLVQAWHDLDVYEDTVAGLAELAKSGIVVAFSNGNYRQLVDLAKNRQLPLDGILSAEFFGAYKACVGFNPLADNKSKKAYISASYHLSVPPERIAMVAAHIWDLEGAAQAGFKTIFVPRPAEYTEELRKCVRSKAEGGSVDLVVKDFKELAALAAEAKKEA